MSQHVHYQRVGPVGVITLDRLPLNLIDQPFLAELFSAYAAAGSDSGCRAVVVESASPQIFSAGLDLKAAKNWDADELRELLQNLYLGLMDVQSNLGKPTIAAPTGTVRGGGITLCIQCDLIIADENVEFAYSEIDIGLVPAIHLSHLPRQAGRHAAFAPLFTGRSFGAEEAFRLGLLEKIAPAGEAGACARDLARILAQKPPATLTLAHKAFRAVNDSGYRETIAELIEIFLQARFGADGIEGLAAFAAKRPPVWSATDNNS